MEHKTKEECYNEATLKSLGNNPQGTRMDVIYLAMDIYLEQFKLNTFPTDAEIEDATQSIINDWYNKNIRDDKAIEGAVMETVKWMRDKIVNYDGHKMVASVNSLREILPNPTEKENTPKTIHVNSGEAFICDGRMYVIKTMEAGADNDNLENGQSIFILQSMID